MNHQPSKVLPYKLPAHGVNTSEQNVETLKPFRLQGAKVSFATRRADLNSAKSLISGEVEPKSGDIVLAKVVRISQHTRLHTTDGRRARLYEGDEVVVCYGNRYAIDQFEALVPPDLSECHLVAAGGMASVAHSRNNQMKAATIIQPIGLLADEQKQIMNISRTTIEAASLPAFRSAVVIAVVGTEMNAGKTSTAASIIRGAKRHAEMSVGAAKITGTGAAGDYFEMVDAGADTVCDFVDVGFPSTYLLDLPTLIRIFETLLAHLLEQDPQLVVIELADGLLQQETAALLGYRGFRRNIDGIVLAANDSTGAVTGVSFLQQLNLPIVGVSGMVAASELGRRAVHDLTGFPTFDLQTLRSRDALPYLTPRLTHACFS